VLFFAGVAPGNADLIMVESSYTFSVDNPVPSVGYLNAKFATIDPGERPYFCTDDGGEACRNNLRTFWVQKGAAVTAIAGGSPPYPTYCSAWKARPVP
jgi:hypothetical protein